MSVSVFHDIYYTTQTIMSLNFSAFLSLSYSSASSITGMAWLLD